MTSITGAASRTTTGDHPSRHPGDRATGDERFQLTRGGIVNVWQYDHQVFDFGGGRLLLRGTNGAGKSKTLEMLLPFVIDGDKSRLTASGKHHTSLLWLMLDGHDAPTRTGYLWVEFQRTTAQGDVETVTCGIGLRASESARAATTWFFTSPRRVGVDLDLEDAAGPLTMQRLRAEVEPDGHFFDNNSTRRYREHVGGLLFGLPLDQYDDLLRLLYWLRQPQVGEDLEPRRLAEQLVQALPQVDESAIRTAGDTFDQLEEFGEQIDRQERTAAAIGDFLTVYSSYARGVVESRATAVLDAESRVRSARREVRAVERALEQGEEQLSDARDRHDAARVALDSATVRIQQLMDGPEARAQRRLLDLERHCSALRQGAAASARRREAQQRKVDAETGRAEEGGRALLTTVTGWVDQARAARTVAAEAGLVGHLSATAALTASELAWRDEVAGPRLRADLDSVVDEPAQLRTALGLARAAVEVVEEARVVAERARAEADRREAASAEHDQRVERLQRDHDAAASHSMEVGDHLATALARWLADPAAVPFELPELSRAGLRELEARAADAIDPIRADHEAGRAGAAARRDRALDERADLTARRTVIEQETDPSPQPPSWRRAARTGSDGNPFWRMLDFRPEVLDGDRAGIEAALEASGLLDAWVTPDGRLVSDAEDVFIDSTRVDPVAGDTLAVVLRPDPPADGAVPADVVAAVLARVSLGSSPGPDVARDPLDSAAPSERPVGVTTIGRDGSWRVGVLAGRHSKATPQYIGATARAAERTRRLAELDAALARLDAVIAEAGSVLAQHESAIAALETWRRARPRHDDLIQAWATEDSLREVLDRAAADAEVARTAAERARGEAATAHRELVSLAEVHQLPITPDGLRTRRAVLDGLASDLTRIESAHAGLVRDLAQWEVQGERARSESAALEVAAEEEMLALEAAGSADAELNELRAAAGASVAELELRLAELRAAKSAAETEQAAQDARKDEYLGVVATTRTRLHTARDRLAEAEPALVAAQAALLALEQAPGLIGSALGVEPAVAAETAASERDSVSTETPDEPQAIPGEPKPRPEQSGGTGSDGTPTTLGAEPATEARSAAYAIRSPRWTPLDPKALLRAIPDGKRADDTALIAANQSLGASAAAHVEPRIAQVGGAWIAVGRGDGGEQALVELEAQLTARVVANKQLLSQRERTIFEEQVLGYLGDSLRGVRLKAEELVRAMNTQLQDVTTSQGIRVRLRWRLRDDISADAKRAVELLGQPVGALLAHERVELREALHRLIEASRAEAPEESYAEHLSRALDYRRWFGFSVQYHRPETGEWRDLQRKSALSQGEQKVLCYLPLFAAAAAHFTSVAGAAPYAPRFVLLDDAFPKIDARTHPLLFGLLVDLDLDFVVTSERLWGTHATVPELAIYEALRSPGQRGIAQYEHRWDGQQLTAVGAALV